MIQTSPWHRLTLRQPIFREPGGARVNIFDGFQEIEIVLWHECQDCHAHLHISGKLSASWFLQHFSKNEVAMDALRRLIREQGQGLSPATSSDSEVLNQVAQMLATGELHATRKPLVLGTGMARSSSDAAGARTQPASQPSPSPRPRTEQAPPPPPPEELVFLPNVDPAAIAQILTQAALSGVPFCEE